MTNHPKANRKGLRLLAVAAIVVLASVVSAQTLDGPPAPSPCKDAAVWHLHQAMRFGQAEDQPFHLGAAQAAQELASLGDDCKDWQEEASRPGGPTGSMTASDADALQAGAKA